MGFESQAEEFGVRYPGSRTGGHCGSGAPNKLRVPDIPTTSATFHQHPMAFPSSVFGVNKSKEEKPSSNTAVLKLSGLKTSSPS